MHRLRNAPLDLLQWGVILVVIILFFRGRGSHSVFLAVLAIVPALRFALSRSYRHRVGEEIRVIQRAMTLFSVERQSIPGRAAFWVAAVPMWSLALLNGANISSMDNYPTILTTANLIEHGSTRLTPFTDYRNSESRICQPGSILPYWIRCTPRGAYSAYPLGMMAFALPVSLVSKALGTDLMNTHALWRLSKFCGACVAALIAALFLLAALHLVSPRPACAITWCLVTGSALVSTVGQGLWTQGGVTFGLILVLFVELRVAALRRPPSLVLAGVTEGAAFALMFACRLSSAVLITPLGLWILSRSPQRALVAGGSALLLALPLGLYYRAIYGIWFGPQLVLGSGFGALSHPAEGLLGSLFSPACGFLLYQAWALVGLGFVAKNVREDLNTSVQRLGLRGWTPALLAPLLAHLGLIACWPYWQGGYCWGSRMLTEIVPLVGLFAIFPARRWLETRRGTRALVVLGVVAFLLQVPGLFFHGAQWNDNPPKGRVYSTPNARYWDWSDAPFLYPFRRGRK